MFLYLSYWKFSGIISGSVGFSFKGCWNWICLMLLCIFSLCNPTPLPLSRPFSTFPAVWRWKCVRNYTKQRQTTSPSPAKLELRNRKSPEVIIQKLVVIDWLGDMANTSIKTLIEGLIPIQNARTLEIFFVQATKLIMDILKINWVKGSYKYLKNFQLNDS